MDPWSVGCWVTAEKLPTSSKLAGASCRQVSQLMQVASTKKLPVTLASSRFFSSAMAHLYVKPTGYGKPQFALSPRCDRACNNGARMVRRMLKDDFPTSSTSFKGSGQGCPLLRDLLPLPPSTRRDASFAQASTFLSCAFCEQEGHLAAPSPAGGLFQHPATSQCRRQHECSAPSTTGPPR